jgi:hypothetical protein
MIVIVTQQFFRDLQRLPHSLQSKTHELLSELNATDPARLRRDALPGWRLHALRGANTVSLSVDMNFRVLARLEGPRVVLLRVVKHDTADRAEVNRNESGLELGELGVGQLRPRDLYEALVAFGLSGQACEPFLKCETEDDVLSAAGQVAANIGDLALTLYETSGIAVPRARCRTLHADEDFVAALRSGDGDWQLYLHGSQRFIVELPTEFRAAIVGSAGTGKTIAALHRTQSLLNLGRTVGFVCPSKHALAVSSGQLARMTGLSADRSYFLVPQSGDDLLQLSAAVDHIVVDEAQEIPSNWLALVGAKAPQQVGVSIFYDFNQLGGNIENGDIRRYKDRISGWKEMIAGFPNLQKFTLAINYRNAREIAEYYTDLLGDALPTKPTAEVPAFESGEVVTRRVKQANFIDTIAGVAHQLLRELRPRDVAVVSLNHSAELLAGWLQTRGIRIARDHDMDGVLVATASQIRGHERQAVIVAVFGGKSIRRNLGIAIEAYVAMSRATKQLFVLEVAE